MNVACPVIEDLLPLYAEGLASPESRQLVQEHLETCERCRESLAALQEPKASATEDAAPIGTLKKELRRRRWRTAAIAALCVFVVLFAILARVTNETPVPYREDLLQVEGLRDYDPEADLRSGSGVSSYLPEGWATQDPGKALVVHRNERVNGVSTEYYLDEETGELTVYLQYFSTDARLTFDDVNGGFSIERSGSDEPVDLFYPAPDRLIYGFGNDQVLLWGEPMNGGVQFLPRLALAYYALIAIALTALLALFWAIFRKKSVTPVLRQLCFAPLSYLLAQLLIKGLVTTSIALPRDLRLICIETLALYALLTLCSLAIRRRKAEKLS